VPGVLFVVAVPVGEDAVEDADELVRQLAAGGLAAASTMYAAEGQTFVLAACGVVSPAMRELLCDTPDKEQLLLEGGGFAMIYGPDGRPLCDPLPETEEGVLTAEIDLGAIALAKAAADPVGHYARPDVTRLLFNPEPAHRRTVERLDTRPQPLDPPANGGTDATAEAAEPVDA